MGTHVSKVRSLRLDRLSDATLRFLEAVGNDRCNEVFEKTLPLDMKPRQNTDSKRLQAFIRAKWAQRAYVSSDGVDPDGALRDAVSSSDVLKALAALAAAPDPSALLSGSLHLAAQKGDLVVAALLVLNGDSGELLNAVDAEGRRPHDLLSGDAAEALAELLRPR